MSKECLEMADNDWLPPPWGTDPPTHNNASAYSCDLYSLFFHCDCFFQKLQALILFCNGGLQLYKHSKLSVQFYKHSILQATTMSEFVASSYFNSDLSDYINGIIQPTAEWSSEVRIGHLRPEIKGTRSYIPIAKFLPKPISKAVRRSAPPPMKKPPTTKQPSIKELEATVVALQKRQVEMEERIQKREKEWEERMERKEAEWQEKVNLLLKEMEEREASQSWFSWDIGRRLYPLLSLFGVV